MLLGLAYQLIRFIADLVLVRTRSDAQLRAEVLALRHQLRVLEGNVRLSGCPQILENPAGSPQSHRAGDLLEKFLTAAHRSVTLSQVPLRGASGGP